jgi:formylglycine-generating enzyme required for sulfatase activity
MAMPSNDAEPIHRVRVDGLWIDETVVTNEQFAKFVAATGYARGGLVGKTYAWGDEFRPNGK